MYAVARAIEPPLSWMEFNDMANGHDSLQYPSFVNHLARRVEFPLIFRATDLGIYEIEMKNDEILTSKFNFSNFTSNGLHPSSMPINSAPCITSLVPTTIFPLLMAFDRTVSKLCVRMAYQPSLNSIEYTRLCSTMRLTNRIIRLAAVSSLSTMRRMADRSTLSISRSYRYFN